MSTQILCVGKMKDKPYRLMADEYLKRLSRYGKYEECEVPDLPEPASGSSAALEEQLKAKEGEALLAKIRPGDRVIALTIGGKLRSSEDLAKHLAELKTGGVSSLVFVIGGSLGLGKNVLARADEEMSMSPMTFPHRLARVMLLEQLYRAEKIALGRGTISNSEFRIHEFRIISLLFWRVRYGRQSGCTEKQSFCNQDYSAVSASDNGRERVYSSSKDKKRDKHRSKYPGKVSGLKVRLIFSLNADCIERSRRNGILAGITERNRLYFREGSRQHDC